MKSGTFVSCHCWVDRALCAGSESFWKLQFCHGRECCKKSHPNIESLKWSLRKEAVEFSVDVLRNSIDEWPQRLKDFTHGIDGYFENYLRV